MMPTRRTRSSGRQGTWSGTSCSDLCGSCPVTVLIPGFVQPLYPRYGLHATKALFGMADNNDQSLSINVGDTRAVIIMDAHCIIQMANKGA